MAITTHIKEDQNESLLVLNASAGSGKTYNLVKEFLKLVIGEKGGEQRFSQIIAMTFTNKASLEMKTRILKALDELSYPDLHGKKSEEYASDLGKELGIDPNEVHNRAKKVLEQILHRYEDLYVMTIDKFNLRLIRSFSRDLDLPNDFEVILNEKEVIEQVVDMLLDQLGRQGGEAITNLVLEYSKSNLDEGERWNFRDRLIEFGNILSRERDKWLIDKLLEMDLSSTRLRALKKELNDLTSNYLEKCNELVALYHGLMIDAELLPGKSRTSAPLERVAEIKKPDKEPFTEAFLKNCQEEPGKGKVFPAELREACIALAELYETIAPHYTTLDLFTRNFYNMALLKYMAGSLEGVKKSEQLIRISEFNTLISELVRNEEAPFIYERLGTRFHHFLLDEFQDTSRLQWLNMVPLIYESLSNERKNLIVGDPKQSIYRFKNGVAEQFVKLPGIYNPEGDPRIEYRSEYFRSMGVIRALEENWRSAPVIVHFNNQTFTALRDHLPDLSRAFYNSVTQVPRSNLNGLVEIISAQADVETIDKVPQIVKWIEACEADGFQRGDICILSDVNRKATIWAVELTRIGYKVVSSESLLVQNEIRVKLIVSYIKRRLSPSSESEKRRFAELYLRLEKGGGFTQYRSYLETRLSSKGKNYTVFNDARFLADHFGSSDRFFFKYENVYDLVEQFFELLGWDELNNPYLHHFADLAHAYELTKGPDLRSFLSHYDEQRSKLAIQMPESKDAIKIMTIHKSKGLEFPVVIVPDLDFDISLSGRSRFLLEAEGDKVLYTSLSQKSPIPEVRELNEIEKAQILTDKVNLCYVALTRPMERLYVMNQFKKEGFGAKLHDCFMAIPDGMEDEGILRFGERSERQVSGYEDTTHYLIPQRPVDRLWFPDISLQDREELVQNDTLSAEQRFGNQFHHIMSSVNRMSEAESTLERAITEGFVEAEFRNELLQKVKQVLEHPVYASLFSNAQHVYSERSILFDEQRTIRPDKIILKEQETIVIDYKTGLPNDKFFKQVQGYLRTLQAMDLPNVKGYLYYTTRNELVEVTV